MAHSLFRRATRPMLAFDMGTSEIVFLKDYWRANVNGVEKEGDIYALLELNRVPNIAPFGKGNDVRDHTTLTHTLRDEKWACWSRDMVVLRPQALPDIPRCCRSAVDFILLLAGVHERHS